MVRTGAHRDLRHDLLDERNPLRDARSLHRVGRLFALVVLLAVLCGAAACRGRSERAAGTGTEGAAPASENPAPAAGTEGEEILLLFPGIDDDFLHVEKRRVVPIASPEDRAVQCLEELFHGPSPGLLSAAPEGVRARQVYILADGTAYVDLTSEILKVPGGSDAELQTIYAIVDTLTMNIPQISRIGLLVDGEPHETLGGHIDTRRLFVPDYGYVEESARPGRASPAAPPAGGAEGEGAGSAGGAAGEGAGSAGGGTGDGSASGDGSPSGDGTGDGGASGNGASGGDGASGDGSPSGDDRSSAPSAPDNASAREQTSGASGAGDRDASNTPCFQVGSCLRSNRRDRSNRRGTALATPRPPDAS